MLIVKRNVRIFSDISSKTYLCRRQQKVSFERRSGIFHSAKHTNT